MSRNKPLLYRKANTKAHGVHHLHGGDYRDERNSKARKRSDLTRQSMHSHSRRGLDYTPLFRFLLSRVGQPWRDVHSEAVRRLDRPDPLFWLVALHEHGRRPYVPVGESSYYSGLYVDETGLLQLVDPTLGPASLAPQCKCCTHTFNGIPFTRPFPEPRAASEGVGAGRQSVPVTADSSSA